MLRRLAWLPLLVATLAGLAHAQPVSVFRAYLSSTGNDLNPCSVAQPCRLLPRALAVVQDGGEVWMLDSANYNTGPVAVPKSVTILAIPGAVGSVVASGGPAIVLATAGTSVVLRNLVIVPLSGSGATRGISMTTSNTSLLVEDTHLANLPQEAIFASGLLSRLALRNVVIRGSGAGVRVAGGVNAVATNVKVYDTVGSSTGNAAFYVDASVFDTDTHLTAEDCLAHGGFAGFSLFDNFLAQPGAGRISLVRSTASNNTVGVNVANIVGSVTLASSTITNNNVGVQVVTGQALSLGNSLIAQNSVAVSGTLASLPSTPR